MVIFQEIQVINKDAFKFIYLSVVSFSPLRILCSLELAVHSRGSCQSTSDQKADGEETSTREQWKDQKLLEQGTLNKEQRTKIPVVYRH